MAAKGPDWKPGDVVTGTKYRVVRQIGAGGMGVVYQVVKPPEIQGVLKLMSLDLTAVEEYRTRFLDEVRVLAQLDHPNIVKVFDYDKLPDGTPFYVMELLHGRTVRDVLATMGTLPPRVAFEVTRQLCEALHCAHTHDIPVVHRDIKPDNIFLHAPRHGEPGVKLIDFGVVAMGDRKHDGQFVGTWSYAAPEQIRGERATPATDLYAVGLVLYEMLAGVGPFDHLGANGSLIAQAHLRDLPPPVSKFAPWVPPSIVELVASALAKEPRQRPRDAYAFAERLFELEWANDGKDPNDRNATMEGPLSRILSTAGGEEKPSSKKLVAAAPPRDRLANMPVVGVPAEARREGPTLQGMGARSGAARDLSSPGEDTLLAGLDDRPETFPLRVKKARASDPLVAGAVGAVNAVNAVNVSNAVHVGHATPRMPDVVARGEAATLDAPLSAPALAAAAAAASAIVGASAAAAAGASAAAAPGATGAVTSDSFSDGTTRKHAARVGDRGAPLRPSDTNTDTFASQESDARRATKEKTGRVLLPVALVALVLLAVGTFAVLRTRGPATANATGAPATNAATNSNANVEPIASGATANPNDANAANANAANAGAANANAANAIPSAALAPADTAPGASIPSATPGATKPTRKGGARGTGASSRGDATAYPPGGTPAAVPPPAAAPPPATAAPKIPGNPAKPDDSLIRSL